MPHEPELSAGSASSLLIENVHILTPEGWLNHSRLQLAEGRIIAIGAEAGDASSQILDGEGGYLLPGIIDLHGDAFERHITPRAGTQFPLELALAANDASLVANGITTFFYSITDGFEPGPRSRDTVRQLLLALERLMPRFSCQARVHIRHEKVNTGDHAELLGWLEQGRIQMLSLNDHLPLMDDAANIERYLSGLHRRVSMSEHETGRFLSELQECRALGERQTEELAQAAQRFGVVLASHDDCDPDDVSRNQALGCAIAEFPMNAETARASQALAVAVLMGAPNLVRGGSHVGAIGVREAIAAGLVNILCSDYHYPSLLRAPFLAAELGLLNLVDSWKLVSENPARAAGLGRRKGRIVSGYDADLLLFSELDGSPLSLQMTLVGGVSVYRRGGRQNVRASRREGAVAVRE